MIARALSLLFVLAVCAQGTAQTSIFTLKATGDIADPVFAPRGDKIAADVGPDRICIWSALDGTLIQTIELPGRPAAKIFDAAGDELLVSLRNGTIQVRATFEPGGTFMDTRPSRVGTSTCAPSAASQGASGTSISRS